MTKPLQGRVALVTGASRGIGRSAALAFAQAGAHVVALARTSGALEELDDEIRALKASESAPLRCFVSISVQRIRASPIGDLMLVSKAAARSAWRASYADETLLDQPAGHARQSRLSLLHPHARPGDAGRWTR